MSLLTKREITRRLYCELMKLFTIHSFLLYSLSLNRSRKIDLCFY
ncbi:Uncharacterised protein [Acinetobacter baumannii]|nr:Uncharacterised protein [Acinetobacter baumannii]SVL54528.1 Uncharacterised protein [Klebsiella pneumoniae]